MERSVFWVIIISSSYFDTGINCLLIFFFAGELSVHMGDECKWFYSINQTRLFVLSITA